MSTDTSPPPTSGQERRGYPPLSALRRSRSDRKALGVAGGLGLPLLARPLVRQVPILVSPAAAISAFLFSCLVTVIFGTIPAYRASRLDPVEALRHE